MGKTSVMCGAREDASLSAAEIAAALDALSPDDKLKLGAIEAIRRGGTALGAGELLHETVCRALMGERNCPRDVPFMAFLVETMRSIAHHERERRRRSACLTAVPPSGEPVDGSQADRPATDPSPEDILAEKEDSAIVQAIQGHFEDDPEAQLVLMGWADGERGAALREATGLDQGALDYAAKRIRTRMRALYPQGWIR
jgi:DNA-directed RNA polymerase specialized sigma24 family protein